MVICQHATSKRFVTTRNGTRNTFNWMTRRKKQYRNGVKERRSIMLCIIIWTQHWGTLVDISCLTCLLQFTFLILPLCRVWHVVFCSMMSRSLRYHTNDHYHTLVCCFLPYIYCNLYVNCVNVKHCYFLQIVLVSLIIVNKEYFKVSIIVSSRAVPSPWLIQILSEK